MVAASRMGNKMNPRWCFSDVPFDMNLVDINHMANTDGSVQFMITMRIKPGEATEYIPHSNRWENVACESF